MSVKRNNHANAAAYSETLAVNVLSCRKFWEADCEDGAIDKTELIAVFS